LQSSGPKPGRGGSNETETLGSSRRRIGGMEEKDSGVVEVRVLCSSGETKGGGDEMILGATLGVMMIKI